MKKVYKIIILKTLWWDTIKRITSCRPELLMLQYSHKGCQRSPTKLVYRRLHRRERKQVKRLLFRGEKTSFFTSTVMNGLLIRLCLYFINFSKWLAAILFYNRRQRTRLRVDVNIMEISLYSWRISYILSNLFY